MRYDDHPSCGFFLDRPCARPHRCILHRVVLLRPRKKRHLLRAARQSWYGGQTQYHRTGCGMWLHSQVDAHKPAPLPSRIARETVYYLMGWDRCEVITTTARPTCARCLRAQGRKR